jgi:hypothetical protein
MFVSRPVAKDSKSSEVLLGFSRSIRHFLSQIQRSSNSSIQVICMTHLCCNVY